MTHRMQTTALDEIVQLLAEQGFNGLADALRVLHNEVMKPERSAALGADPHQRAEGRTGHANGYKPTSLGPSRRGSWPSPSPCPRPWESSSTPRPWRSAYGPSGPSS
jgi:hypothetical protein